MKREGKMGFEGFILHPVANRNPQVRGDGGMHEVKEEKWLRCNVRKTWLTTGSTTSQTGGQGYIPGG